MENPALGSVLASGSGSSITSADPSTAVNIAPGVVPSKSGGLGRGAQRMELETYKEGIRALKNFLESLDQPAHQNGQNDARQGSSNGL